MLIDELQKQYPLMCILKQYPISGQKWVYLVSTEQYGNVILKIIKKMDDRVKREIAILNENNIPSVPKILETGVFDYNGEKHGYYFEEYIEGESLSEVLKRGALPIRQALHLMQDLLTIVAKLEEIGIVHRDIKPGNIICAKDGNFHLIDFGIARNLNLTSLTLTDAVVGPHTPGYGAPELFQYDKPKINSRADLFSVGVVMYEAIFGRHPFVTGKEADYNEIWYNTATVFPSAENIPGDTDKQLIGLILTLMQKQASKRPPSAAKALEWYNTILSTLSI